MNVDPDICPVCNRMPCHGISMGPDYLVAGYKCRARTGNWNRGMIFYLCKMCIRKVYVV